MRVYAVTVFENGDNTTSIWGVFASEEKAEIHKADVYKNAYADDDDSYFVIATISEHEVE